MSYNDNSSQQEPQINIRQDGRVYLQFPKNGGPFQGRRYLGRIQNRVLHVERDPDKHLLRALGAYGFNYELIKRGGFERVIVHAPTETLETTRETILLFGKFFHFKRKGFEVQIFLRVSDFGKEPPLVPVVKRSMPSQFGLFGEAA